jgi:hypothetical protein
MSLARTLIDPYQVDKNILLHWYTNCKLKHKDTCWLTLQKSKAKQYSPDFGPTKLRVINISSDRVIPAPERCEYVALSYVWVELNRSSSEQLTFNKTPFKLGCSRFFSDH